MLANIDNKDQNTSTNSQSSEQSPTLDNYYQKLEEIIN